MVQFSSIRYYKSTLQVIFFDYESRTNLYLPLTNILGHFMLQIPRCRQKFFNLTNLYHFFQTLKHIIIVFKRPDRLTSP